MSFLNPEADQQSNAGSKIHARELTWSGGAKKDPNDPTITKAYAEIRTRDGSGQTATKGTLPEPKLRFAPLGTAMFALGGVVAHDTAGGKTYTSYWSNETTAYGQALRVWERSPDGNIKVAAEGDYDTVYAKVGSVAQGQYYLYYYDFDRKCIDRFCFKGSSKNEWKAFQKTMAQGQLYKGAIVIEPGEFRAFEVGGGAVLPKFSQPAPYTDAELAEIKPFAEQYMAYEQAMIAQAQRIANEINGSVSPADGINQLPPVYDGEQSQEYPEAPAMPTQAPEWNDSITKTTTPDVTTDMTDVPF